MWNRRAVWLFFANKSQQNKNRVRPADAPCKRPQTSDMYNRKFPGGNFLFFFSCKMSLFCLPCGKLPLAFLAVPAGKDGRVECPCQTVDDFIGIGGSVCGLFLFVQTHAPLIVPPWQSRARKSKFQFYQAQGRRSFLPCTCGWRLVDGLQVPVVMRLFHRSAFLQTVPYTPCAASGSSWFPFSHRHHQAPGGDTSSRNQHPAGFAGRQLPARNS